MIYKGKVVWQGNTEAIDQTGNEYVDQFIHGRAEGPIEAVRSENPYDLILTDINMPDINGLELVSFVKNARVYSAIPLVIVSTEGSERDRDKGLGLGADAYVAKPFEPEALRQLCMELLARGRS